MKEDKTGPGVLLARVGNTLSTAQRDLGEKWQCICDGFQHHVREAQDSCGRALHHLGQQSVQMQSRRPAGSLAHFASMTMSDRRLRPLFDLAFNPAEIKNRLTSIPIFVVAHKDDSEFVLVSGEGGSEEEPRQLGLFFFTQKDAEAMVNKVYDFAVNPVDAALPQGNVIFRFMPDAEQVKHALEVGHIFPKTGLYNTREDEMDTTCLYDALSILNVSQCLTKLGNNLYKDADMKEVAFTGVPVFQAEGLTVKTDKSRYTPLFFSKEDLDAAVGNAYEQREQHRESTNKAHSVRASADLEAAQSKYDSADGQTKDQAREGLAKARARNEKYRGRVEDTKAAKEAPKVEVGCLEEVLQKMLQAEGKGDWGSVMFVPAGSISQPKK